MDDPKKSIDEILDLPDEDYTAYVGNLLKDEYSLWKIDELNDGLLEIIKKRPADVERVCRLNSIIFSELEEQDSRTFLLAYNFNTYMGAAMFQNKISDAKSIFLEGIEFCQANKHYEAGKSLSQNVFYLWKSGQMPHDEALFFLTRITDFYNVLGKPQDVVEALCAAAMRFADAAAFQSAYRGLADAQQIAIEHKLYHLQIRALETQATVALMEGDLSYAEKEFDRCVRLYGEIGEIPPFLLKANAALVKLRQHKYPEARDLYLDLIKNYSEAEFADEHRQAKINLLVCCRELNDAAAIQDLSSQVENDLGQLDLEQRIEARLVLAKTYFHIKNFPSAYGQLKNACVDIQIEIDQYQRLHYRRGVRERYVSRVKCMLANLEASGSHDDVIHALVLCYSNALLDWLSTLDWTDLIQQSAAVPISTKNELLNKTEELIRFGTPFLQGFREKYDDPFEFAGGKAAEKFGEKFARAIDFSLPWREFNDLTSRINEAHNFSQPFDGATVQRGVDTVNNRLSLKSSFLFSFVCADGCVVIYLAGNQFHKSIIPSKNVQEFFFALSNYQRGNVNRESFKAQLNELQLCLQPAVSKIANVIENSPISELVFVPDQITEGIPVLSSLLTSDILRTRIKKSEFIFRTCPTLKEQAAVSLVTGPSLCVSDARDCLELVEAEKALVKKTFPSQECFEIDLQCDDIDFSKPPVNSARALHLVTHNIAASAFTDPNFVATSTDMRKNGLWLESVQHEAHKLQFALVVLNGCNTGTTMSWNYYRKFSTNEKVGLSSIFLLNRRCAVVATQWNVPEVVGYVFSSLFYKRMTIKPNPALSFAMALVDLHELTKELTIKLLGEIPDKQEREKRCEAVQKSQNEFPFRDTYCLGMFQHYSLLPV